MPDYWMENAMSLGSMAKEPRVAAHTLIDLGYFNAKPARDRADQLLNMVSRKCLQIAGFGRLLVRIPPTKVGAVLAAFPGIKPATKTSGYSWCTHTWFDPESTDLKHARG